MDEDRAIKWRNWVTENLEKGASEGRIREAMKSKGVDFDEVMSSTEIGGVESAARSGARGVTKGITSMVETAAGLTPLGMGIDVAKNVLGMLGKDDMKQMVERTEEVMGRPRASTMNQKIQDEVTGTWRRPESMTDRLAERGGEVGVGMVGTPGGPISKLVSTALGAGGGEVGRAVGGDIGETIGTITGVMTPAGAKSVNNWRSGANELKKTGINVDKLKPGQMPADQTERGAQVLAKSMASVDNPELARKPFTNRDATEMAMNDVGRTVQPGAANYDDAMKVADQLFDKFRSGKPVQITKPLRDKIAETPIMMQALKNITSTMRDTTVEDLLMMKKWDRNTVEAFRRELSGMAKSANNPVPIRDMAQNLPNEFKFPLKQLDDAVDASNRAQTVKAAENMIPQMLNPKTSDQRLSRLVDEALGPKVPQQDKAAFGQRVREEYMPVQRTNKAAWVQKNMNSSWNPVPAALALGAGMPARFGFEIGSDVVQAARMNPKKAQQIVNALSDPSNPLWKQLKDITPMQLAAIRAAAAGATQNE